VVQLQIALEDACAEAAKPHQVLLCHRGTLDALAYWLRNGWDEGKFFAATGDESGRALPALSGRDPFIDCGDWR
jgi:hypothetical protein